MRRVCRAFFIVACVLAAVPANAQALDGPSFIVRIHDYVHVAGTVLADVESLVSDVYAGVGLQTQWAATLTRTKDGLPPAVCDGLEDVTVILLNREMPVPPELSSNTIGFAVAGLRPGRIAYVLYDRVDAAARAADWRLAELLGVVIAHEVGHLLLPSGSDSSAGVMRGTWTIDDLRRSTRDLRFSVAEGMLMRATIGSTQATR